MKQGNALLQQGFLDEAAANYRQAIVCHPDHAEAHLNLGFVLKEQGRYEQALPYLQRAVALDSQSSDGFYVLGVVERERGELQSAVRYFERALAVRPDFESVYRDLCHLYFQSGQIDSARRVILNGLEIYPQSADFHADLGSLYFFEKQLGAAVQAFQRALMIQPEDGLILQNLAKAYLEQGEVGQAIEVYRKAADCDHEPLEAESSLLFALSFDASCDAAAYLAQARHYGEMVRRHATPYADWPAALSRTAGPLRIGMVSGDLRQHPVGFFLEAILTHLDPAQVELVAYSMTQKEDALTARLKPRFAAWNVIRGKDDATVARQIRDDGIQILIDLAGHTGDNRLPVFAWKAAPVQASWLGYWASTGVPGMDYLLADPVSVPEAQRAHFTEQVWYLPDTRLCFTAPAAASHLMPTALPALEKGHVTFGSFQNLSKVNEAVLAAWGRIFAALPQARLRLQTKQMGSAEARLQLLERLGRVGIAPERVTLLGSVPREAYLAAHGEVDMILDTFPFPGGTTTCEALWMGVPTVTLAGDTLLSRQGASLQGCVGLSAWIAETQDEYVEKAVAHAQDLAGLARLRAGLRERVLASPLYEAPRFAAHWQQALQDMWKKLVDI